MNQQLAEIANSPQLPEYVAELQALLTREQKGRERYYDLVQEGVRAEFINGEVVRDTPSRLSHSSVVSRLFFLIQLHLQIRPTGIVRCENTLIALSRNDYIPDLVYFSNEKAGLFRPDDLRFPAPAFVVEVLSDSTRVRDRGTKLVDYAAHRISEYWIIDPDARTIEQFREVNRAYEAVAQLPEGRLQSHAIEGFEMCSAALFDDVAHRDEVLRLTRLLGLQGS